MNILFITNELNYSDGVSGHLFYLLNNLKKRTGIKTRLICGGGNAVEKFTPITDEIKVNKNIHHSNRSIKKFTSAIHFVYKNAKDNKTDIVHSHNHYASNIASKASKFGGFRTVQTVHGLIPETGRLKHYTAEYFIAVNDHVAAHLLKNNIPGNKTELIYNGIDFEISNAVKSTNEIKIISASRLEKGKGIDTFIKAVSLLNSNYKSKAEFLIAGGGSMEAELKELNDTLKAGIIFKSDLKYLRKELEQTHIFVIASESEGLPITLLEAAASKNLIISSDFPGIENIIKDNKEGFIFKMNNAEDLSKKLQYALDNLQLSSEISETFFQKAKKTFNAELMADKHFRLYNKILS